MDVSGIQCNGNQLRVINVTVLYPLQSLVYKMDSMGANWTDWTSVRNWTGDTLRCLILLVNGQEMMLNTSISDTLLVNYVSNNIRRGYSIYM